MNRKASGAPQLANFLLPNKYAKALRQWALQVFQSTQPSLAKYIETFMCPIFRSQA